MGGKRAKKQSKRKNRKRSAGRKPSGSRWFAKWLLLLLILTGILGGTYYFGSFETRAKMENLAAQWTQPVRTHPATPDFLAVGLDTLYDAIPSSTGFVVEGSELGRDPNTPFIAGVPESSEPTRAVRRTSYVTLVNEPSEQSICIALRLDDLVENRTALLETLPANSRPAGEVWDQLVHLLGKRYPERFEEIWIYLGPVYEQTREPASTARAVAHYAIIFDLTEIGGLRALTLRIPRQGFSGRLETQITSIAEIEAATGIQFLPELDFSLRSALVEHRSPSIW